MKIFKYRLPFKEQSQIAMPIGAKIIRVDDFDGAIFIWAIVDESAELENRHFRLFKTGGDMPADILEYNYIGCGAIFVQMELMMYVFEKPNSSTKYIDPTRIVDINQEYEA